MAGQLGAKRHERTRILASAAALLLAASGTCLAAPAMARPVDRGQLDALIAKADGGDAVADPQAYLAAFTAALDEARQLYPDSHPEVAARRAGVATALAAQNRLDEASAILAQMLPRLERAGPAYRQALGDALSLKGYIATFRSDHATALATFERSVALFRELAGDRPTKSLATELANLASANWEAGRSANTLELNAQAIAMGRALQPVPSDVALWYANRIAYFQVLGRNEEAIAAGREGLSVAGGILPEDHPVLANIHANLGAMLIRQERPKAAAPLLRRAFEAVEKASGAPNQNSAVMRGMFATALADSGEYDAALAFLDSALPIITAQLGADSNRALQVREVRARVLMRVNRLDEAQAEQLAILAARDGKLAPQHRDRMSGRANLARIALARGDYPLAERAVAEAVALRSAAVPPSHPELLAERSLLLLVRSRAETSPRNDLLAAAHEVYDRLVANAALNPAARLPDTARFAFRNLAEVLQRAGDSEGAFRAQQWSARTSVDDTAAAVASARAEAGHPAALEQIASRRRLVVERSAAMAMIEGQLAAPKPGFDLAAANGRIAALDDQIGAVDARLAALGVAPARFAAASFADVRQRLRPGEMFMQASVLHDRYLVTALSGDRLVQYLTPASSAQVEAQIAGLRRALDGDGTDAPFDRAAAAQAYRLIFAPPLDRALRRVRHLLVSANGALGALPFAVLVPGRGPNDYLADHVAISRLPGVPRAARTTRAATAPQLFAMGDVDLPGAGTGAAVAAAPAPLRDGGWPALVALPSAAGELVDLAAAVGAAQPSILTGAAATEAAFRKARIMPGAIVAFATHGFVSGEIEGLREPALLLSAQGADDGLLTASEIGRLDVPASWVILSACNTAAGAGPDAPGLSGLAQAFMLAGADHILATHWRVRDDAARAITGGTMRVAASAASPAEALRQSMAALRKGNLPGASHPALWAAFELVE